MRKSDGDIEWTVETEVRGGTTVHVLRFEKLKTGPNKGRYHPYFYVLPQIFLAQFIEPSYDYWEAYLGAEMIDSNIVLRGDRIASTAERDAI